ncbi:hypothetical protein G6F46_011021 [Rhizopus delemar]|uniref:Yeast cell wall synthesis Kre9/Knh1-like N-terminal domain-containing protein n=2 Tax=Rhizopus TaxID=4842 RepID=A0A9P6YU68_9FUNG|nr:hypothetical protein G6F55_010388 [Rhizopus delemar]KAG1548052.1 hypothetical protein G6F51_003896 [Rhizopus arrhizus]KAG1490531.1 hypothetical protein G6F54_010655 [Rhizopus delemar]KAG1508828.1 hypothetical protein G6F53_007899 [Rhizopus delemar]KAG1510564.1 hypothetical protein G6F52_010868 [Rhizopus delemar]
MVSFKTLVAAALAATIADAAIAPSYPQPGTIQVEGQSYDITWTFDGKDANQTYQIDFMTGSNTQQTVLKTIATDVPANRLKYPFVAPAVDPYSAIYFFMFTGSNGDQEWTTRFGIVPNANTNLTTEPQSTQPDGQAIPWGNGTLASNSTTNSTAAVSSSSADIVAAAVSTPSETVIPVVQALAETSSGSVVKPMLSLVAAAAVAGSMWM